MNQSDIQQLLQQLGNHLDEIKNLFSNTPQEKLSQKPSPNVWSPKELLGHLHDVELVFHFRLKKLVEEDGYTFPKFNHEVWVEQLQYNQWDCELLADSFIILRRNLIFWLGRISEQMWQRKGTHPESGLMTFEEVVRKILKHYEHHYAQIRERLGL